MPWTYPFDAPPPLDPEALTALLGGKGANLVVMARDLGLPVPPGIRHHHRSVSCLREYWVGRPEWTRSCASGWPRSRPDGPSIRCAR